MKSRSWLIVGLMLFIYGFYVALYTFYLNNSPRAFLELLPAVSGIGILIWAGFRRQDCYLRVASISKKAIVLFAAYSLVIISVVSFGHPFKWNWAAIFVYAPLTGIAQELFFRSALLPVLTRILSTTPFVAVSLQAILFGLWHAPKAFITVPSWISIILPLVTFGGGLLWGWQVQRDKTVVWAMGFHVAYQMIMQAFYA